MKTPMKQRIISTFRTSRVLRFTTSVVIAGHVFAGTPMLAQATVKASAQAAKDVSSTDIHLDACVEIAQMPTSDVLTYIRLREGEDFGGVSSVLLGGPRRGVASYQLGPPNEDPDHETTIEPFIRLPARRQGSVRRAGQVLH